MVPKVVGSNPIFHPKSRKVVQRMLCDFLCYLLSASLLVMMVDDKERHSRSGLTFLLFGGASAASRGERRYGENICSRSSQSLKRRPKEFIATLYSDLVVVQTHNPII